MIPNSLAVAPDLTLHPRLYEDAPENLSSAAENYACD